MCHHLQMDNYCDEVDPELRRLYPNLTDEELRIAEENLQRYLELTLRIYERIRQDPEAYALFKSFLKEEKDRTIQEG